jgi:hypothetical protein
MYVCIHLNECVHGFMSLLHVCTYTCIYVNLNWNVTALLECVYTHQCIHTYINSLEKLAVGNAGWCDKYAYIHTYSVSREPAVRNGRWGDDYTYIYPYIHTQSLESLRSEMVDGVTSIEFSHLRVDAKIGSGSFAEVYRVSLVLFL